MSIKKLLYLYLSLNECIMAKVNGLLNFTGTLNGLNFYTRKGVPLVRTAGGGFNSKAIKTKAAMVRVRENGAEFKDCMITVKHFKSNLAPFLTQFKDGELHQRLVSLFTKIKTCDTVSERGKRSVGLGLSTTTGKALLMNYVLTMGKSLSVILNQPYHFEYETGLELVAFDGKLLRLPNGATHLKIMVGFLKFDFENQTFCLVVSDTMYLNHSSVGNFTINPLEDNTADGRAVGVVFAQYVQELSGVYYPFKQSNEVVLEVVYVE